MKGFAKEFREFIAQGNVMDMAVGIIIGGAFTAIVTSLVDDIISPIIGMATGGIDFSSLAVTVGDANLTYGNFISAIINFLIIALVVFLMIKSLNKVKAESERLMGTAAEEEEPVVAPTCPYCLEEIKDGATRCPHCGADLQA